MRRIFAAATVAVCLLAALAPGARTDEGRLQLVRVRVTSPEQAAFLMAHFDDSHNHSKGEIELVAWPGDRADLDALGFDYRVVVEDLVAFERAEAAKPHPLQALPGPDYSDYRRLPDYNREMTELAEDEPSLVKMFEMPRPSLEGRPIFGLEIAANVGREDGRPIFYIDAVHHAREWPASEFTMIFAHYLTERFGKDDRVTALLKKARVILVPVVNVDGFNYSRESVLSLNQTLRDSTSATGAVNGFEGYWRKNRRSLTGVTVPVAQVNPDAYGVDPNRNYAYLWGDQQGGSSNNQFSTTYRGAAPFSEPEVANVRDIVLSRGVTGIITNHTYQASVLRAGGGLAPEDALLERIGARMARLLEFDNRPSVGYPTTGTTDDWAYAAIGALGFTIEHGRNGFHCAYEQCVGAPTDRTMDAFTVMLDVAADPRYHSVLEGRVVNGPAKLTLKKTFKTPLSPGNPINEEYVVEKLKMQLKTERDGSFEWHVGPSDRPYEKRSETYTLTITAGGKTKTVKIHVERGERLNLGLIRL